MKPGATTKPSASMIFLACPERFPISTILLSEIPTSARLPGEPVPSTTVPLRMRRSKMGNVPGLFLVAPVELGDVVEAHEGAEALEVVERHRHLLARACFFQRLVRALERG